MTRIYQYAMTSDPRTVEVVRRNDDGLETFRRRAIAWGRRHGSRDVAFGRDGAIYRVNGLLYQPEGFGQWTQPDALGISRPLRSNNEEYERMEALAWTPEAIPGLPPVAITRTPGCLMPVRHPVITFTVGERAFAGYRSRPDYYAFEAEFGPQWTAISDTTFWSSHARVCDSAKVLVKN